MDLFLSTSRHKLDSKGRVSVPAGFRAVIDRDAGGGLAVAEPYEDLPCIEGFGLSRVAEMADQLESMSPTDALRDAWAVTFLAGVTPLGFDQQGRIVLPSPLLERAGLAPGRQVLFAGLGRKFQIWAPEAFEAHRKAALAAARANPNRMPWRNGGGASTAASAGESA